MASCQSRVVMAIREELALRAGVQLWTALDKPTLAGKSSVTPWGLLN